MGILPKPPVKKPPVINNPPPSAPEPLSLSLIGMGASGVAGFYLGRRREKKQKNNMQLRKFCEVSIIDLELFIYLR
jgi:hypothetical protein